MLRSTRMSGGCCVVIVVGLTRLSNRPRMNAWDPYHVGNDRHIGSRWTSAQSRRRFERVGRTDATRVSHLGFPRSLISSSHVSGRKNKGLHERVRRATPTTTTTLVIVPKANKGFSADNIVCDHCGFLPGSRPPARDHEARSAHESAGRVATTYVLNLVRKYCNLQLKIIKIEPKSSIRLCWLGLSHSALTGFPTF